MINVCHLATSDRVEILFDELASLAKTRTSFQYFLRQGDLIPGITHTTKSYKIQEAVNEKSRTYFRKHY